MDNDHYAVSLLFYPLNKQRLSSRCMWYSLVLMYFWYYSMPMLVFFKVDHWTI